MRVVNRSAARRWARALLDVANDREKAGGPGPAALADEIATIVALFGSNPELQTALTHPALANERRKGIARAICQASGASDVLSRLLDMLIERERINWLPEIAALFAELWNAQRGVARAEAITATAIDAGILSDLGRALGKATHFDVDVFGRVDPAVLGGVLVRMGGKTFDGTVRSQLRTLRQTLIQGA